VRLLLDTHAYIWWQADDARLGPATRRLITQAERAFISIVSAWKATIKASLDRLTIPEPFETSIDASGFEKLDLTFRHVEELRALPRHHQDPFDRMLICQARVEGLTLVSQDRRFAPYGLSVIWA